MHRRLIAVVEEHLRAGYTPDQAQLDAAALAYEALGLPSAARRARTNSRDFSVRRRRSVLPAAGAFPGAMGGGFF